MTAAEYRRGWLILGGVVVALVVGVQFLPKGYGPTKRAPDYGRHCAVGFNQARKLTRILRNTEMTISGPGILREDPPARIQCGFRDEDGRVGMITLEVRCDDPMNHACQKVVAVIAPNGQPAYMAPTERAAPNP